MTERTRQIGAATVPTLLYGTAWKEAQTADLVAQALRAGFRGLDTANQRWHYREADVGRALVAELEREHCTATTSSYKPSLPSGGARITGFPMIRMRTSRSRSSNHSTAHCHTSARM
jgi:diketogulonate reductase-like aldo/keto reductase